MGTPCDGKITIPGILTLPCGCVDPQPTRHLGTVWHITDGGRNIMSYALAYVRMRREEGLTDEQSVAVQRATVICWGAWVSSVWAIPKPVQESPGSWVNQLVTLAEASGLPAAPPARLRQEYKALLLTVRVLGNGSAGPRPVATDVRSGRRERLESTRLEPSHSPHPPTRARSRPQERIYEFFLKAQEKLSDVPRPQALETTVGQNDLSSRGLLDLSSRVDGHDTQIARLHLDLLSVRQGGIDLLGAKVTSSAPAPLPDFACELPGGEVGASVEAGAV